MIEPFSFTATVGYFGVKAALVAAAGMAGFFFGRAAERSAIADIPVASHPKPVKPPITIDAKPVVEAEPVVEAKPVPVAKETTEEPASFIDKITEAVNKTVRDSSSVKLLRNVSLIVVTIKKLLKSEKILHLMRILDPAQVGVFLGQLPGLSFLGTGLLISVLIGGGCLLAAKMLSGRLSFLGELRHVWEDVKEFGKFVMEMVVPFTFRPLRV